jgi:hypothetical protein
MNKHLTTAILLLILAHTLHAQQVELIQFSGVTMTADSLNPIPYTHIRVKNTSKGVVSDAFGFFSFVAHKKDTVLFDAVGYKPATFVIPDSITRQRYSLIQLMSNDTLTLAEAVIFPWPTYEDFKETFVTLDIPDDDLERARKNLEGIDIRNHLEDYPMDASMNYNNFIDNQTSRLYYFGQQQPFQIFNPFAWAKFIQAWKEGKFKRKTEEK